MDRLGCPSDLRRFACARFRVLVTLLKSGPCIEMSTDVSQTCTGPLKAFRARFSITITTTGILAMSTERKTRSVSQIPGIRNGFRYFLTTSQSAQNGENEG